MLQAWPFVNPALAAAAVATGLIPIIIHWLNRRRYRRVPWAAMMFLRTANQQSVTRMWFERWLLLLLRMAAMVLLGMAVARPFFPASRFVPIQATRSHRVILLDDSLSMRATDRQGRRRFDRAKLAVEKLLHSFPETDAISLVTLSAPAEAVIRHASFDHRFVRERLDAADATQSSTDIEGGLALAHEILKNSPAAPENRSVYLLTDFTGADWASQSGVASSGAISALQQIADALPRSQTSLNLISVSDNEPTNAAITRLELETPMLGLGAPVRLAVNIANFGSTTLRGLKLETRRVASAADARGSDRRLIDLPAIEPGAETVSYVSTVFDSIGVHGIEARLIGATLGDKGRFDDLVDDDTRFLSVEARTATTVLLVDGRPGSNALAGQSGFLATALAPQASLNEPSMLQLKTINDSEFAAESMGSNDVIALCNVGRLTGQQWKQIEQFVGDGGGLLVFAGDQLSLDNYNQFGFGEGRGALPVKFGPVRSFDEQSAVGFKVEAQAHGLVADFASEPTSGFFSATVSRYQSVEPNSIRGEVLLHYSNDDPAMIIGHFGRGRVAVSTTSANMDWTNLPAKGDYVTLMLNTIGFLAPTHGQNRNGLVGETIREPLTAAESSLPTRVTTGDGTTVEGRIVPSDGTLSVEFGPADHSGLYSIGVGSDVRVAAVNVDDNESELRSASQESLLRGLNRPVRWIGDPDSISNKPTTANVTELGTLTAYVVLALLIAETWIAMKFGTARGPRQTGFEAKAGTA